MPRKDGTGPTGNGPVGPGGGQGTGEGRGANTGAGRGKGGGNRPGSGPGGNCVCPKCGAVTSHQRGVPCAKVSCPECGEPMIKAFYTV